MNIAVIQEIMYQSLAGTITFPQVVGKLLNEGIEAYHVDLILGENRYYQANGEAHVEPTPFEHSIAAQTFSSIEVAFAIKSIQIGQIDYQEFLRKILAAGTVYYIAYLSGRKVIYFGRNGDLHIEPFSTAK